jgi:hypothetical protein
LQWIEIASNGGRLFDLLFFFIMVANYKTKHKIKGKNN